jgi:hypothetical protein
MQKSILHIELPQTLALRDSNRYNSSNGRHLNNRTKYIFIVNAIPLFEPFSYQSSLILIQCTINFSFHFINPLAIYNITSFDRWD